MELLTIALGGGISAAVVSGAVQIILWRLGRKAALDDRKGDGDKEIRDALRSVLRNGIVRSHREFVTEGRIGRYSLQSVIDMHDQYKRLGGNAFVDEIIKELKELPLDVGAGNAQR
jgi:hypothetical protein